MGSFLEDFSTIYVLQVCKCVVFVLLSSLQVSDPLDQALKFLRPLQNLASNRIETHLLAYEVFIRRSTYIKTYCDVFTEPSSSNLLSSLKSA